MVIGIALAVLSAGETALGVYLTGFYQNPLWWIPVAVCIAFLLFLFNFILMLFLCFFASEAARKRKEENLPVNKAALWMLKEWALVVLFFSNVSIKTTGREKMPKEACMIAFNHLSGFDALVILSAFQRKRIVAVSKKENFEIFFEGGWTKLCGFFPMDRSSIASGTRTIQKAAECIRKNHASVMIAPEGTRNRTFESTPLLPFRPGAFSLAKEAHCPIAVLCLQNTSAIIRRLPFRHTNVYLDLIEIISVDEVERMSASDLSERVRGDLAKQLEEKKARIYHGYSEPVEDPLD